MAYDQNNKKTILVVDDAPENLDVIRAILAPEFSVKVAPNGALALRIAETQSPDLILLDVVMPKMDGYEVCMRLKANPATWGIPVVFVTAMTDIANEEHGFAVGAADYISKPFRAELVRARVRSHLEVKEYKDDLERLVEQRTCELSRTQEATIFTVGNLAEIRDPETGAHILRTRHYVAALARHLSANPKYAASLSLANIELMAKSAPLYDIGKVGIPDHILLKPGKLTALEFEEMKTHAKKGWETLNLTEERFGPNTFLRYACEITLSHHESGMAAATPKACRETRSRYRLA